MFIKEKDISLNGVDLENQIPVITAPVGYGKTRFAIKELRQVFSSNTNRKIMNVLLLVPTRSILEQVAKEYSEDVTKADWFDYIEPGLNFAIKVACFASPANYLAEGNQFKNKFDLVIIDELDLIAKWTASFPEYIEVWKWIEANRKKMIVCGITATPEFLVFCCNLIFEKVLDCNFKTFVDVTELLEVKHKANRVEVCPHITLARFMRTVQAKPDSKMLVYTQSARECYRLSKQVPNSGFIVSSYNEEIPEGEEKTLAELMSEQVFNGKELRNYVFSNEALPQEINCLFINDACSVGLNIKDAAIKTVICDSCDKATIRQVQGRIRQDIEKLIIVYETRWFNNSDFDREIERIKSKKDNSDYLEGIHSQTLDKAWIYETPIGEYRYNPFYVASIYWKRYIKTWLEPAEEYFSELADLAKDEEINFLNAKTAAAKADAAKANSRINRLDVLGLLNKEENFFTSKELKELCSSVGIKKKGGKGTAGVPTLVEFANASGLVSLESLGRTTRDGKRATWYRAAKIGG